MKHFRYDLVIPDVPVRRQPAIVEQVSIEIVLVSIIPVAITALSVHIRKNMDNIWYSPDGEKIACTEKIKVMQQNISELQQLAQDAFEDGILMGVAPQQIRQYLAQLMLNLTNPYSHKEEALADVATMLSFKRNT